MQTRPAYGDIVDFLTRFRAWMRGKLGSSAHFEPLAGGEFSSDIGSSKAGGHGRFCLKERRVSLRCG